MTYGKLHILSAAELIVIAALLAPTTASATGVAAGTLIENTASATYSTGSATETVNSNTVSITVDELLDVTVSSLDGGNVAITSSGAVLTFQLTNSGNGPEAYKIDVDPALAGDDFDPAVTQIAYDSNSNGIYDAGVDTIITAGNNTPSIDADNALTVFVVTNWATAPGDGDMANVRLTASAATGTGVPGTVFGGQGEGGGDAVVGANSAEDEDQGTLVAQVGNVMLSKSQAIVDPFGGSEAVPGATVTYTLAANVTGSGSVSSLVVSDTVPTGTTYVPASLTLDSAPLTDASGDDAGEASGTAISVDLGTVSGGTAHTIKFSVSVD